MATDRQCYYCIPKTKELDLVTAPGNFQISQVKQLMFKAKPQDNFNHPNPGKLYLYLFKFPEESGLDLSEIDGFLEAFTRSEENGEMKLLRSTILS